MPTANGERLYLASSFLRARATRLRSCGMVILGVQTTRHSLFAQLSAKHCNNLDHPRVAFIEAGPGNAYFCRAKPGRRQSVKTKARTSNRRHGQDNLWSSDMIYTVALPLHAIYFLQFSI